MKVVIQRVSQAHVIVDRQIVGKIEKGLLVLVGIINEDLTLRKKYVEKA